jgi:DNA-binding LacI/PurR family transcriptional regulator
MDSGYSKMKDLLESQVDFTAVFVASDTVALGAKAAIRDHGLIVPDDIAMVGFDDLPFARYTDPPLTTVCLPVPELARQAGEMLISLLNNEKPGCQRKILDTCLVIRESCGSNHS